MSTCNRLDLQTLGSQPLIMPTNLPDHWVGPHVYNRKGFRCLGSILVIVFWDPQVFKEFLLWDKQLTRSHQRATCRSNTCSFSFWVSSANSKNSIVWNSTVNDMHDWLWRMWCDQLDSYLYMWPPLSLFIMSIYITRLYTKDSRLAWNASQHIVVFFLN